MTLPKLATENYQFTLVATVLLVVLGLSSYWSMPRSEDPQFDISTTRVVTVYPGASPEDIETLVVDPMEEAINEAENIKELETRIFNGVALTIVEFHADTDPDATFDDVSEAVARVRPTLPDGVRTIELIKTTPADANIFQAALVSPDAPMLTLKREAERLERAFEQIDGVQRSEIWAYPEPEVRVGLSMEKLRELGITSEQVIQSIQATAENVPGGTVDAGPKRFNVQTTGDYESVEDVARTVVHGQGDRLVYLKDVADVRLDYADDTHRGRLNGERAVFVTVVQRDGTNIFTVRQGIEEKMNRVRASLPDGVSLEPVFDQSTSVEERVGGFFANLMQGIALVGLVVLLALGFRAAAVVMTAIPVAIMIAINWVDVTGYGLQQMSIVGLVIALGLLVDNAIVVTENAARYLRKGYSGLEAAAKGTAEVGWAIVAATVTSVLAFGPLVTLPGTAGDFTRSMPLTVVYALVASLLLSLTLTPMLSGKLLGTSFGGLGVWASVRERLGWASSQSDEPPVQENVATDDSMPAGPQTTDNDQQAPTQTSGPLQRLLDRAVETVYRDTLGWALDHPKTVLTVAVAALIGSAALFPMIGVSLFPKAEKPQFLINVETPEGSSLDYTDGVVADVERMLDAEPEVKRHAANVGRGNPRVYYNVYPERQRPTVGQVYVELHSPDAVPPVARRLRSRLKEYAGAEFELEIFENGPPVEAPIAIKVIGPNLEVLRDLSTDLERTIRETPGTRNVENPRREPKTDLKVNVDRDKAGLIGVPLATVDQTVLTGLSGLPVATYRDGTGEDYDVVVRLPLDGRPTVADFDRLYVSSVLGARVPLRQIADLELERKANRIDHFDLERAATVTADVAVEEGYNEVAVTQQIVEKLDEATLPAGYRYHVAGKLGATQDNFANLGQALFLAMLGILAVLVLQFQSFRQPLIIFAAIPLAIIGAFPALYLTGYTFSFMAFVGFISLVGIVVNNSIILVDYANQLLGEGHSVREAVTTSGETRFTPILLTVMTTIGGLLPLTLTLSEMWTPLGLVIIGGLLASTFLTLLVVPVLYALLTPEPANA
jgi:multidrug efflux pump subunit AcrB